MNRHAFMMMANLKEKEKRRFLFYSKGVIRIYKIEGKSNKKRKTINNVNFFISTFWPSPDPGFCLYTLISG